MLPSDPRTSYLTDLGEDGNRVFTLLLKWLQWSPQKGQDRGVESQLWARRLGSNTSSLIMDPVALGTYDIALCFHFLICEWG